MNTPDKIQIPRIVISMGDPLGVGPEIVARLLAEPGITDRAKILILGDSYYLRQACQMLEVSTEFRELEQAEFHSVPGIFSPLKWVGDYPPLGLWTQQSGRQSFEWVKLGAKMCLEGLADALVTAPISKAAWKAAGAYYPGHTELLAEVCGSEDEVMMLAGGGLRVALLTIHEPLSKIPQLITPERLQRVSTVLHDALCRMGIEKPRIGVLGLNPHAGEEGHMGREEVDVLIPAMEEINVRNAATLIGPLPADTAFHRMLLGDFDALLAMYHDQGLAPLKTVAFDTGINVTLGLPIVRSSVDHGTAFDIAGKGVAKVDSLRSAFEYALKMSRPHSRAE